MSVAQPAPDTLWTRTYGGSSDDYAFSVQRTTDGGYIVAGGTTSFGAGDWDLYLVKTSSQGDTLWTRHYEQAGDEYADFVQQTADGGYVVSGFIRSFDASYSDLYLVKTNNQGDTLWTRAYGGSDDDEGYCVQETADGGFIAAGYTKSFGAGLQDFYLVRTDGLGDTLWTRTYGGSNWDEAFSCQRTVDGNFIVAGFTGSFDAGYPDFYLVKINNQGDTLWTRTFGGSNWDVARSVQQTADGGYIVAGETESFGAGNNDFYLVKTNSQGEQLWTRTYGGSDNDEAFSVQQTADGGYIVAGETESFGAGNKDFYLVKTNSQGDQLWTRTYGGSDNDGASSVQLTADGGYIVAGETESFGAGAADFYLVKTGPDQLGATPENVSTMPAEFALNQNYPNPFNPSTKIVYALPRAGRASLIVSNLLGQKVADLVDEMQAGGSHTVFFDGSAFPSGVYLYRLQTGEFVQTKKMLLLK
jgi:uncharacterized delta-60 repeat protein